ncbi:MAG: archaellin/type IV pilin N-terminal domain-containing protein [Candidatus Pacearchaeota archaeon]
MKVKKNSRTMLNKKGISEVVSYVLLIVVVVSISVLVYGWLRTQIPQIKQECPDDVSLFVKGYNCDANANKITITFQNKGLFQIDGAYVRISNKENAVPIIPLNLSSEDILSSEGRIRFGTSGLASGKEQMLIFNYFENAQIYHLQVEPFIDEEIEGKTKEIICSKSTITIDIDSTLCS